MASQLAEGQSFVLIAFPFTIIIDLASSLQYKNSHFYKKQCNVVSHFEASTCFEFFRFIDASKIFFAQPPVSLRRFPIPFWPSWSSSFFAAPMNTPLPPPSPLFFPFVPAAASPLQSAEKGGYGAHHHHHHHNSQSDHKQLHHHKHHRHPRHHRHHKRLCHHIITGIIVITIRRASTPSPLFLFATPNAEIFGFALIISFRKIDFLFSLLLLFTTGGKKLQNHFILLWVFTITSFEYLFFLLLLSSFFFSLCPADRFVVRGVGRHLL